MVHNNWQGNWDHPAVAEYYLRERSDEKHIYPSECVLFDYLREGDAILDFGCGPGGFCSIIGNHLETFEYRGIDHSPHMIECARELHPDINFTRNDGTSLPLATGSCDLVFSFGTLHMTPAWREVIRELWRVTRRDLIFDMRLVEGDDCYEDPAQSYETLQFADPDNPDLRNIKIPYIILGEECVDLYLHGLAPAPGAIRCAGYWHEINPAVVAPVREVLMRMFVLRKKGADQL